MSGRRNGHHAARLSGLYGSWFLVVGIQLPFWPLWLETRGLDAAQIGLVLMIGPLMKVLTGPLFAHVADHHGIRRNLIVALAWASLASFALFAVARGFGAIVAVSVLAGAFFPPMIPLIDNLSLLISRGRDIHYGRMRLWGSLAFVAATTSVGVIIVGRSIEIVLWLTLGALAVTILAASLAPKEEGAAALGSSGQSPLGRFRRIFADRRLMLVLAAAGAIQASHGVYYVFGTIHWRAMGLADDVIGVLWGLGVISEVILFALIGGAKSRFGPVALLVAAGLAGTVRWSLLPVAREVGAIALLQCLHAFTFGAAHLAAIKYIARHVPIELSATVQSLYSALSLGLVVSVTMAISGYLYQSHGGAAYFAMAGLSLGGVGLALMLGRQPALKGPGQ